MYNRYVPNNNGTYERIAVQESTMNETEYIQEPKECRETETAQQQRCATDRNFLGFDLGDLLLLCIVILLLVESEGDDILPILIMAAAFLMQQ